MSDGRRKLQLRRPSAAATNRSPTTPARPIEVVVNPDGAPRNYDALVDAGLAHTGAATGLEFTRVGLTDDRDLTTGAFSSVDLSSSDGRLPKVPDLTRRRRHRRQHRCRVACPTALRDFGRVMLDRDLFASFGARDVDRAQAIVDHELALTRRRARSCRRPRRAHARGEPRPDDLRASIGLVLAVRRPRASPPS